MRYDVIKLVANYMTKTIPRTYMDLEERSIGIEVCKDIFKEILKDELPPIIIVENYLEELEVHQHRNGYESKMAFDIGEEVVGGLLKLMS